MVGGEKYPVNTEDEFIADGLTEISFDILA